MAGSLPKNDDFAELHQKRQRHPHLIQQLLWEELRQANPDGYRYSRFCELYQRWRQQAGCGAPPGTHAGEKLFVDSAETTIPIYDPRGGPVPRPPSVPRRGLRGRWRRLYMSDKWTGAFFH